MYTKIQDLNSRVTSLIFFNCDFAHVWALPFGNSIQRCESANSSMYSHQREEYARKFKRVIYTFGNSEKIKKYLVLDFDFENNKVTINNKIFNVGHSLEFIYKKTRGNNIQCINGIEGFYKHIVDCMNYESAFNYHMLCTLEKWSKTKAIETN